jgi:predicted nucleotidyltransferase
MARKVEVVTPTFQAIADTCMGRKPDYLRDLARLSGLAVGTIQREVNNLRDAGLILEKRDGNRLYLRANASSPIFHELQGIAFKTMGLRQQLENALSGLDGIDLAFVYGSFAEGKVGAESDVDFFVIGTNGLRKLAPKLSGIANTMNREINPNGFAAQI